jgi:hypothetical protein
MSKDFDRRSVFTARPRPEWVTRINEEGEWFDKVGIIPLDEDSLIATACRQTGLSDFGPDDSWRRHFRVLIKAIEEEGEINLLGRMITRSDMLIYLRARLQVFETYKQYPEIDAEVVKEPVFIIGLGRSGTTILHEVLSQDEQFRCVRKWEALFPCPPPETATYEMDSRIKKAHQITTIQDRISPEWKAMHAIGGTLPVECVEFTPACFLSDLFSASFQVPTYGRYLQEHSFDELYQWHRKLLKLLQWRHKRPHWLLKGPNHLNHLPELLRVYPDAKIILPHRDPIVATASLINVVGTIYRFRSDAAFSTGHYENFVVVEQVARMLEGLVDCVERGILRPGYFANIKFVDFSRQPLPALLAVYKDLGLDMSDAAASRMQAYLQNKPKGVFGKHTYELGDGSTIARERALFTRYQDFFQVPSEI